MVLRHGETVLLAVALAMVAEALYLVGEFRAPWSGIALIAAAAALVAAGFKGGWRGVLLGSVATALVLACWYLSLEAGAPEITTDCDPSCGINLGGLLALVVPVAAALSGLGAVVGRLHARIRVKAKQDLAWTPRRR